MLYYGYFTYYAAFTESPRGNHECAGMHNGGNVDRSIGPYKPHPTAGSRAGAYCL